MNVEVDITGIELHTKRLLLRPFMECDLGDLYEYAKVPGVGEMAGWTHHNSIEESKYILDLFRKEKKTFAIVMENKVIGSVGIEKYEEDFLPELLDYRARELGFVLSKEYWGKGIMSEAVYEVMKYCFYELKLDVIICGHYSFNNQSKRLQDKIGFTHYKRERKHFSEIWGCEDQGWYSLLFKRDSDAKKFNLTNSFELIEKKRTYHMEAAHEEEKNEILSLYKAQLGRPYCPWNAYYPEMDTIENDLKLDALFVMKNGIGEIIGAVSIDHDPDCDALECWNRSFFPSGELSRLCVLPEHQNQGLARELLRYGMEILKKRGFIGVHFLVNSLNVKAINSYDKLHFSKVGECDMYGQHFLCYEKRL